jgi:hypothetical protein
VLAHAHAGAGLDEDGAPGPDAGAPHRGLADAHVRGGAGEGEEEDVALDLVGELDVERRVQDEGGLGRARDAAPLGQHRRGIAEDGGSTAGVCHHGLNYPASSSTDACGQKGLFASNARAQHVRFAENSTPM